MFLLLDIMAQCLYTILTLHQQEQVRKYFILSPGEQVCHTLLIILYLVILHTESQKFPKPAHVYSAPIVCGERILTYHYT